jgi:hypothetical protein
LRGFVKAIQRTKTDPGVAKKAGGTGKFEFLGGGDVVYYLYYIMNQIASI